MSMKSGKGFTLIETMVAITILTLSIAAPLYSAGRSLSAARNASNQLTASYLAQEGIEHVRMMRDNAYLNRYVANSTSASAQGWSRFRNPSGTVTDTVAPCKAPTYKCTLTGQVLAQCPANNACTTAANVNGVPSIFIRSIQAVDSVTEVKITSNVTWKYRNTTYSATTTDTLTPWQ